jgi:hypothetical protein
MGFNNPNVSVSNFPGVQPVSASALPLPDGASSEGTSQAMLSALNDLALKAILDQEENKWLTL